MSKKVSVHVWLDPDIHNKAISAARASNVSLSALVSTAVTDFLEPKRHDEIMPVLQTVRRMVGGVKRDIELVAELVSLYIYHWLCSAPPVPEKERKAILIEGRERHKKFLELLEAKLSRGDLSLLELLADSEDDGSTVGGTG